MSVVNPAETEVEPAAITFPAPTANWGTIVGFEAKVIEFAGREFPVPTSAEALGLTHAICGLHEIRGPMVLKWTKENQIDVDFRLKILGLYGRAVSNLTLVAI